MIVIIDYGLGNLSSVAGAVLKVGYEPVISNKLEDIKKADKLILPGVGAFADGIANLEKLGLIEPLRECVTVNKKPILGICLGFQLLAKESCEFGHSKGLGFIDASVKKLEKEGSDLKIPHIGWNDFFKSKDCILFDGISDTALFYYVHSYHFLPEDKGIVVGECDYGKRFVSAINKDNIYGTQFHPEKSQKQGLILLKNFLDKA